MAASADLDYQQAPRIEVAAGGREYVPRHIEAVLTAGERDARLVAVLARQSPHAARRHVRRIADDKIVMLFAQGRK